MLSVVAAVVTMGLKAAAYRLTGSVGLFADALESGVNLLAAVTAYIALRIAARPADPTHAYGHEKIEYFSSGLEGVLVCLAGAATAWYAAGRIFHPQPLDHIGVGVGVALAASAVNLVVGRMLLRAGRAHGSIVLEADGQHLMTDVLTTAAVAVGLVLVAVTGRAELDAALAVAVGLHIIGVGLRLVRRSFDGLMDHALPPAEQAVLRGTIRAALPAGADFHHVRTRQAGRRKFVDFHLLVDGDTSVRAAHGLAHAVEARLRETAPGLEVTIHVEPIDEGESWEAEELEQLGERPDPVRPTPTPPIDD